MRALTLGTLGLVVLASACRSEIPSDSTLCWKLNPHQASAGPQYGGLCEPQLCFQEVRRDSLSANPWKSPHWSLVTPDNLSTDEEPLYLSFTYADSTPLVGNYINVYVDNRVTLDPSLENFRKYVQRASGKYETYQGEVEFKTNDVEVLDYKNGRLKVRIHATFEQIMNGSVTLNGRVTVCAYHASFPGSDPDPGEIILEVEGPIDTTPLM